MTPELFSTILVAQFGRGALQPLRAARLRLAIAGLGGLSLGIVGGLMLRTAPLPHDVPWPWASALCLVVTFFLSGLLLLSMGAGSQSRRGQSSPARLATAWPLSCRALWLLTVLPYGLVLVIVLLALLPLAIGLSAALALPAFWLLLACGLGAVCSLGLAVAPWPRAAAVRVLLLSAIVSGCIQFLILAAHYHGPRLYLSTGCLVGALLIMQVAILWWSYRVAGRLHRARSPTHTSLPLPGRLVHGWWFMAKVLRNPRTAHSLLFCLAVTTTSAVLLQRRHLAVAGGSAWLLMTVVLATSFAADVRGLARRHKAPEIAAVYGPRFFVGSELQATYCLTLLIGLPLLTVLLASTKAAIAQLVLQYLALQLAGTTLGLLASTIFVPRAGEIGMQLFAATIPTLVFFGLWRYAHLAQLQPLPQAGALVVVSLCAAALTLVIEIRRSQHYGRT